jgi:hypothetical protein
MLPAAQHCLLNHILSGLEIAVNDRQDNSHEGAWNAASHPCRAVVTARSCHAATTRRRPTAFSQTLKIPDPSPGPLKRTAPAWRRRGPQVRQPLQRRPRQPRLPKPRRAPGRVHPDPGRRARARAESAPRPLRVADRQQRDEVIVLARLRRQPACQELRVDRRFSGGAVPALGHRPLRASGVLPERPGRLRRWMRR